MRDVWALMCLPAVIGCSLTGDPQTYSEHIDGCEPREQVAGLFYTYPMQQQQESPRVFTPITKAGDYLTNKQKPYSKNRAPLFSDGGTVCGCHEYQAKLYIMIL